MAKPLTKTKTKAKAKAKPAKPHAKAAKSKPATRRPLIPKSTRVTRPVPVVAAPPAPPPPRDEPIAARDIGRLIRYGERFGANKIDVQMWSAPGTLAPAQLAVASGTLAIFDPADKHSWKVLDRPAGAGQFRIMLSILRPATAVDATKDELAAIVIHTGRPPIARWTVAQWKTKTKPAAEPLPRIASSTGWLALIDASAGSPGVLALPEAKGTQPIEVALTDGRRALAIPTGKGELTAYWAVDAQDKPICLVIDLEAITQKDWRVRPS
ncbi:MAG: hypothetical protein ABI467_24100 [Kofleriaceae bacterium]